jgi:hypothetical protein
LVVGSNMRNQKIPHDDMVSEEVVPDVYVFGSRMLTRVISNLYGTLIVIEERNMVHSVTIVFESLSHL